MTQGQHKNRHILWIIWYILVIGAMVACTSTEEVILASTPTSMATAILVYEPILENAEQLATVVTTPDDMKVSISPTPTPTLSSPHIIVQTGDTLLSIAWVQDVSYIDFLAINDIDNPEWYLIKPGDILLLPPQGYFEQPDEYIPYKVKDGDSFTSIAELYGIPVEILLSANPDITTSAELKSGYELTIPWGGIHFVESGETLSEIAIRYGVSIEALIAANEEQYPSLSLSPDLLQAGWLLEIPFRNEDEMAISDEFDCSPQPRQISVVAYTVKNGERLICLSSKFGVSEITLFNANLEIWGEGRLTDGTNILIPPLDGVLYTVTADDAANNVTLEDIAIWYGIRELNSIVDWQGRAVPLLLQNGQQLFIPDADPVSLVFDIIAAKGLEQSISTPDAVATPPAPTDND